MLDLNAAERRALAGASCLIGLGLLGRLALAPGPGAFEWEPVAGRVTDLASTEGEVRAALLREQRAQTPLAARERIDPNTAPVEELRRLPGVGPRLAEAIVGERARRPFRSPDDLTRVPGIGEVTARRLAPRLGFGAPRERSASDGTCGAGERVDLNRADRTELEGLPGIGPALASRILERRRRHGPFSDVEGLTAIRGIGARSVERLAARVCVGRP
ncbi:MAG: ComEA family DNA-binding protein [Gemmatimonadota bacterium]|nr:ComEA family DNA-binding protein [Gemmatimonadota bacterium]